MAGKIPIVMVLLLLTIGTNFINCKLPDYIKVCKSTEPDIDKCITNSVNELRPYLMKGIPELQVPAIEPLHLQKIEMTKGITANITDITVHGPSNFQIIELKANIAKNKFIFRVNLPSLYFTGKYKINTRILVAQITGEGPIHGNFTDYNFRASLKGNRVTIDGKEFLKFNRMKLNIILGQTYLHLDNLFNGDPVLGKATNDVINDSNVLILDEIRPVLEDALEDLFTDVANKILLSFPYSELFP